MSANDLRLDMQSEVGRDDPRLSTELWDEDAEGRMDGIRHVAHEIKLLIRRYQWLQNQIPAGAATGRISLDEPPAGHVWIIRHLSSVTPTAAATSRVYLGTVDDANFVADLSGGYRALADQWIYVPEGVEIIFNSTGQPLNELYSVRALVAVAKFETQLVELSPRCEKCSRLITACICQ